MDYLHTRSPIQSTLFLILLMATVATHASLLDCAASAHKYPALNAPCSPVKPPVADRPAQLLPAAIPAQPIRAVVAGFQTNQPPSNRALPDSAPFVVLVGALVAVLLVRAKSNNSK